MLSFENITLENVRYRWYGAKCWEPILSNVSFHLHPGEMLALVGNSGQGKSLLLQCALNLLPPTIRRRGEIKLDGAILDAEQFQKHRGKTIYYVPQGVSAFNPLLTVKKHLTRAHQLSQTPFLPSRVLTQLNHYQLDSDVLDQYPRQLSGGMAKRVLACNAALSRAKVILADEITAWIDHDLACILLNQMKTLCHEGASVLWVTHDLTLAARFADRIVALQDRKMSDVVTPEQLRMGRCSEELQQQWEALPENSLWIEQQGAVNA